MWNVPDVHNGETTFDDDWWEKEANLSDSSGACKKFEKNLKHFGWTSEQGQKFELPIDMRTLVLAVAVNEGTISMDPDTVTNAMLPLNKKFFTGPVLEDDLLDGEAEVSFDDIEFDDEMNMDDDV